MTRPSHELPTDLRNALLDLEEAARRDSEAHRRHFHEGQDPSGLEYVQAVARTGAARDAVAALILETYA